MDQDKMRWATTLSEMGASFAIINKCMHRMTMGFEKYGPFNAKTTRRNLYLEMEEELLDSINYSLMMEVPEDDPIMTEVLPELIKLTEKVRNLRDSHRSK